MTEQDIKALIAKLQERIDGEEGPARDRAIALYPMMQHLLEEIKGEEK